MAKMAEKFISVTVEYGESDVDTTGSVYVQYDHTETFEVSDKSASFIDLFDDVAFEARNFLPD